MRILLQSHGFELTPEIDAHVRKQLVRNLASPEQHIMAVDVFLGDINGPRGGADKKALLCVQLTSRFCRLKNYQSMRKLQTSARLAHPML